MRDLAKLILSIFKTERLLLDRYPIVQTNILNDITRLMNTLSDDKTFLVRKFTIDDVIIEPQPSYITDSMYADYDLNYVNKTSNTQTFQIYITIKNNIPFINNTGFLIVNNMSRIDVFIYDNNGNVEFVEYAHSRITRIFNNTTTIKLQLYTPNGNTTIVLNPNQLFTIPFPFIFLIYEL